MVSLEQLQAALLPFAREGLKWRGTNPAHDDLTLLCAEDHPHMTKSIREACFTIGDLKAAAALWDELDAAQRSLTPRSRDL